jgi:hypothetical protein
LMSREKGCTSQLKRERGRRRTTKGQGTNNVPNSWQGQKLETTGKRKRIKESKMYRDVFGKAKGWAAKRFSCHVKFRGCLAMPVVVAFAC